MAREFQSSAARVIAQWLLVGYAGASGSGKTWTALLTGTGMCEEMGVDPATSLFFIDTENNRGLQYAEFFKFQHVPFAPPFGSLDYIAAIDHCLSRGAKVIIVDSMSHEHEGTGGMIDSHAREVERRSGGDFAKGERIKMLCWQKPKADRRKLLNTITQSNAHFILCYRAKETAKPDPKATGADKVKNMGFTAITGDEFIFEATISTILKPNSGGVPTWQSDLDGERKSIKVAEQFKWVREADGPITKGFGRRLAKWAAGGVPGAQQKPTETPRKTVADYKAEIDALDLMGLAEWQEANASMGESESPAHKAIWSHAFERGKSLAVAIATEESI